MMAFTKPIHEALMSVVAVLCLVNLGCNSDKSEVESAVYRYYKGIYPDGCNFCSKALREYNDKLMKEHRSHVKNENGVIFETDLSSCEVCKIFCPKPDVCSVDDLNIDSVKVEKSNYDDIWNVTIIGAKCSKTPVYATAPLMRQQFHYSKGRLTFLRSVSEASDESELNNL